MRALSPTLCGIGLLILALLIFSLQDVAVKWLGGAYPVLEIVVFRSLVALPLTLLLFRSEGGHGLPTTNKRLLEYARGGCYFLSYTTYFMGLASLPLAEIAAIKFSGPLLITLLSVAVLGERVGPRRWIALFVGFTGVLLIVRPGLGSFDMGSIFVLLSVLWYAIATMLTRNLHTTDSGATMAYYSSLVYFLASGALLPIVLAVGDIPDAHPSIAFLLRPWAIPSLRDGVVMGGLGMIWAGGMYCTARAYSIAPASVIAPFEYVALPISVLWGIALWGEIPDWMTWAGAAITLASGVYMLFRERQECAIHMAQHLPQRTTPAVPEPSVSSDTIPE